MCEGERNSEFSTTLFVTCICPKCHVAMSSIMNYKLLIPEVKCMNNECELFEKSFTVINFPKVKLMATS
jgi:hypothetical protein